jgi:hypothetical protein
LVLLLKELAQEVRVTRLVDGKGTFWDRRRVPGGATRERVVAELHALGYRKIESVANLGYHYGDQKFPDAIPILLRGLRETSDPSLFSEILRQLGRPWVGPEVASTLKEVFEECDSRDWRNYIVQSLARVPNRPLLDWVHAQAQDPENGTARLELLNILVRRKHPGAFATAIQILRERDDPGFIAFVLWCLRRLGDPRALEVGMRYLEHPAKMVRDDARKLVEKLGGRGQ